MSVLTRAGSAPYTCKYFGVLQVIGNRYSHERSNINCMDGDLYNVAWPGFAHLDYGNDAFSAVRCVRQ